MSNDRQSVRTPLKTKIRLSIDGQPDIMAVTRNISDHGVFIVLNPDDGFPAIGTQLTGQVVGLPGGDAPLVPMEVVRVEQDGIGLKFTGSDYAI